MTPPYRPCVGIMLINKKGLILTGCRNDTHAESWQMPQGGIDKNETAEEAARRELIEEVGKIKVDLIAEHPDWLSYDFPKEIADTISHTRKKRWQIYAGQTQKWFLFKLTGGEKKIGKGLAHPEFSRFEWLTPEEVLARIVPFKRPVYEKLIPAFTPLIKQNKS